VSLAGRPTPLAGTVIAALAASAVALALAPLLMPPSYSWLSMTTSESAAQGVGGAWLARLGFVLFGLSGWLLVVVVRHREWGPAASAPEQRYLTMRAVRLHHPAPLPAEPPR
jgi:hypothetical protein